MLRTNSPHPRGQEPEVQTLGLVVTNGPRPTSKRVHFRGARRVQAPHRDISDGFSIYALHTKTKSTPKNAAERNVPNPILVVVSHGGQARFLTGFAAFLVDFACRDSSIHCAIPRRQQWLPRAVNTLSEDGTPTAAVFGRFHGHTQTASDVPCPRRREPRVKIAPGKRTP